MKNRLLKASFFPEFLLLCTVNLVLFAAGFLLYRGSFHYLYYPLSELGAVHTRSGVLNSSSRRVFTVQMLFNSSFFFYLAKRIRQADTPYIRWYVLLSRFAAVGMLILIFPYDVSNLFHSFGTGIMAASVLLMHTLAAKEALQARRDRLLAAVLRVEWAALGLYGFTCALQALIQQPIQKIAVCMLGIGSLAVSPFMKKPLAAESAEKMHSQ